MANRTIKREKLLKLARTKEGVSREELHSLVGEEIDRCVKNNNETALKELFDALMYKGLHEGGWPRGEFLQRWDQYCCEQDALRRGDRIWMALNEDKWVEDVGPIRRMYRKVYELA